MDGWFNIFIYAKKKILILIYIYSGGFSIVREATHKETGEVFAVKIIEKTTSEEELNLLQREIDIMKKLHHKNIIQLIDVFNDDENIYLILEL